jgi:two-component system, chemotaxis family, protein-glutamate methylesterase/glutaminase
MRKLRILIVDQSTNIRRLLSDALAGDPMLEVAGTAANGRIALAKIPQLNPDLISFDPDVEGLATLAELRSSFPHIPVLVFSARAYAEDIPAWSDLSLESMDFVARPGDVKNTTAIVHSIREEVVSKIKALCGCEDGPPIMPVSKAIQRRPTSAPRCEPVEIIAIGVSTGGPNALSDIFRQLPANLPVPIVVVQHMPPTFTKYLAQRLNAASRMEVREAEAGARLQPGQAWLAPGDFHMALSRAATGVTLRLHQGPLENSCRPAADVLLRSVAEVYGPSALAVVLTGMGRDGLRGCAEIRRVGGRIIAQDEATSVVWGMPGAVAAAGLADQILPLSRIAGELSRLATLGNDRPALTLATSSQP